MQILVVDDSSFARGIIVNELKEMGLDKSNIQEAKNGEDAIGKIEVQQFDLLLLDIYMPGIDGVTVLKEIRKNQPELDVIICSSHSSTSTIKELISLGAKDFLVKPFPPEEFRKVIGRYISK